MCRIMYALPVYGERIMPVRGGRKKKKKKKTTKISGTIIGHRNRYFAFARGDNYDSKRAILLFKCVWNYVSAFVFLDESGKTTRAINQLFRWRKKNCLRYEIKITWQPSRNTETSQKQIHFSVSVMITMMQLEEWIVNAGQKSRIRSRSE